MITSHGFQRYHANKQIQEHPLKLDTFSIMFILVQIIWSPIYRNLMVAETRNVNCINKEYKYIHEWINTIICSSGVRSHKEKQKQRPLCDTNSLKLLNTQ